MQLSEAEAQFDLALIGEVSDPTRQWYHSRIRSVRVFLGDVAIGSISTGDLRRWRADLKARRSRWGDHPGRPETNGGLSPWTFHGYVRAIKRFFKWCVYEGLIENSPAERLRLPELPREPPKDVSRADLAALLQAAHSSGPRDYAVICFLADTGARVGGVAGLQLGDLDLARGRAVVREKRNKARTVYLGKRTRSALRAWLAIRPGDKGDRVFIGQRGPLSTGGIYQVLKRIARQAGVKGRFNPHAFRHAWARGALSQGADLATVSQILGHSDIGVTARFYARWADAELAERHRRFSWLNSVGDDVSLDEFGEDQE